MADKCRMCILLEPYKTDDGNIGDNKKKVTKNTQWPPKSKETKQTNACQACEPFNMGLFTFASFSHQRDNQRRESQPKTR